ncbi:Sec-independent protein translocase protein TatB [Novosphingobium panipatense]|uniref:Sec-independent protein translocase protein TatB n=1 Tax=Novosphingobium panipatense TaxID=428991 RepID=A0ABY1Q7C2_9SPHN|nr:Sec-independent protein translocase protein TatB [Novosphingobium panipatense]SMP61177.1 sec-independent protein translocase protein TatB [Novosphingobium panipatense]
MFDIGASEVLMVAIVAIVVIGPKDMPAALRTAGRWIGKMRRMSNHFRSGIDAMVREAELEEMERKWREQNEAIMKASPQLPSMEASPDRIAHPGAEDMQAPSGAAVAPEAGDEGEAPVRQAELQLPPPPP